MHPPYSPGHLGLLTNTSSCHFLADITRKKSLRPVRCGSVGHFAALQGGLPNYLKDRNQHLLLKASCFPVAGFTLVSAPSQTILCL